jgi:hypothetical protein
VELAAAEEWEERISAAQVVVEDAGFTEVVRYGDRHRSLALMLAHPHQRCEEQPGDPVN